MEALKTKTGYATINNAKIYYETAGKGQPFVMIHAAIADSRQWNNEFASFADKYQVIRYDQRGFGKSEPVEGEYSNLQDLTALLDYLEIDQPAILMGCSMGGSLALDYALEYPSRAKAVIMVDSGPGGLMLDVEEPETEKYEELQQAYKAKDYDRIAELETRIFFDGIGRKAEDVNQEVRQFAYAMNRHALSFEAKGLGKRLPDTEVEAVERLDQLHIPVLIIAGANDEVYTHAAADYMLENIPSARKEVIEDAGHLPNMEHPEEFRQIVTGFLENL